MKGLPLREGPLVAQAVTCEDCHGPAVLIERHHRHYLVDSFSLPANAVSPTRFEPHLCPGRLRRIAEGDEVMPVLPEPAVAERRSSAMGRLMEWFLTPDPRAANIHRANDDDLSTY